MFEQLFSIIAPVLIAAAIGYAWARFDRPFDAEMVSHLVTTVGVPCLVFSILVKVEVDFEALGRMAGAAMAVLVITTVLGLVFLKVWGQSIRAFLPSVVMANTGNMGLPLSFLAFGSEGMALSVAYFTVSAVIGFSAAMMVASGGTSLSAFLRIPPLYATLIALVFMYTGWQVPAWAGNTVDMLADFAIPLMLITLGVSLANLKVQSLKRSTVVATFRMLVGFAIGWGLAEVLGFEGAMRGVLILQSAMPVAVFNYLFAMRYETEPEAVAGSVVISTVASFITLPALLWFIL